MLFLYFIKGSKHVKVAIETSELYVDKFSSSVKSVEMRDFFSEQVRIERVQLDTVN